jgi:hypothetical protein
MRRGKRRDGGAAGGCWIQHRLPGSPGTALDMLRRGGRLNGMVSGCGYPTRVQTRAKA